MVTKLFNKAFEVDFVSNRITLADARFYRTDDGDYMPSTTTLLDAYPKGAQYYAWLKQHGEDSDNIRDEAGRRGSNVHDMTERYDMGEEVTLLDASGYPSMKMLEWSQFERYVEFRNQTMWEMELCETNLVSKQLGYAGTLDRVFKYNGKRILVDIKTSAAIYPTHLLQLAAYKKLIETETDYTIDEVAILWLNAKTRTAGKNGAIQGAGWQLVRYTDEEVTKALEVFNATKYLWEVENGSTKPRMTVYNLSHKLARQ